MKLLADENFPSRLVSYLQKQGYKIIRISRSRQGIADSGVLEKALTERRTIFTFDKEFLSNQSKKILVSVVVFDFPGTQSHQLILSFFENILFFIQARKKKKKPFIIVCSIKGFEEIKAED